MLCTMRRLLRRVFRPLAPARQSAEGSVRRRVGAQHQPDGGIDRLLRRLQPRAHDRHHDDARVARVRQERHRGPDSRATHQYVRRGDRQLHPVDAGRHLQQQRAHGGHRARRPRPGLGRHPHHRLGARGSQRHLGSEGAWRRRHPGLRLRQVHRRRDGHRHRLHVPRVDVRQHGGHDAHHLLLEHPSAARLAAAGVRHPSSRSW